ncbi:enoyl-[acyl-carrier-protein] reductase [NADH] [Azomonas agilis]|uniref:Enoyl-[acyl-carrier-protein] reductase [NADH] n=1 Tax=Azomonas agilis TaxID=116849 RepID=A0A562HZU8_9GAMM|nr:enoyl-ACP reductase FabI [Azomonas agilis]TWH63913.1 enoyl-[acyl-carrier-protein] reductase [NADH] [Azomonas agilis]
MITEHLPLSNHRGLILGVANEHSIAWGCARVLAARGAQLVLSCLNEKAQAVVTPLAESIQAPLHICNVEHPGDLEHLVHQAVNQLGGLDFVVHSIAWAPKTDLLGRVVDSSAEGFNEAMRVSCHSFAELARLVEPHLPQGGALVTMTYIGADDAIPHYGLMGPVKAALESLVRYMALELGPKNIRVHAVSPGPLPTRAASGLPQFDQLMSRMASEAPLGRLVTLDEVGGCVAFLVGPDASGMTGQTLYVDAGVHAVR